MESKLEFQPLDIQIDVSFWMKYNSLKLDKFKLSMDPVRKPTKFLKFKLYSTMLGSD